MIKNYFNGFKGVALAMVCILHFQIALSQGTWASKSNYPGGVLAVAAGFTIGDYGYIQGGTDGTTDFATLYQYDPSSNTWTAKKTMPGTGRREAAAFVIDTVAYVGLGFKAGTPYEKSFYKYYPKANTWTKIADMPVDRTAASGFAIDSLGYVFGGVTYAVGADKTLYAYNPRTNKWSTKAQFPGTARAFARAVTLGKKAYILGGSNSGVCNKDFYSYDAPTDQWKKLPDAPFAVCRSSMSCFAVNNKVYFGQGYWAGTSYQDWYSFNTTTEKWDTVAQSGMIYGSGCAFFAVKNKGYISTGTTATSLTNQTYEYTPAISGISPSRNNDNAIGAYVYGNNLYFNAKQKLNVKIFDYSGRLIQETDCYAGENKVKLVIKPGIYFAQMNTANSTSSVKFYIAE